MGLADISKNVNHNWVSLKLENMPFLFIHFFPKKPFLNSCRLYPGCWRKRAALKLIQLLGEVNTTHFPFAYGGPTRTPTQKKGSHVATMWNSYTNCICNVSLNCREQKCTCDFKIFLTVSSGYAPPSATNILPANAIPVTLFPSSALLFLCPHVSRNYQKPPGRQLPQSTEQRGGF